MPLNALPMTGAFGRAEVVRGFMRTDGFTLLGFRVAVSNFLEISVDRAEISRNMDP
jgi:hypothetical protein